MISQTEITAAVGARVRAARAAAGISRKRLAETAEVSERYLNELENGDANVSIGILARVADALGVEIVSLLPSTRAAASGIGADGGAALHGSFSALAAGMSLREQEGAVALLERYLHDRRRGLKGVALLGLRGAGKSTIGGLFAQRHGLPFLSVTREIETRAGMSLGDLFNLGGPDAYRSLENDVVKDLSNRNDRIVLETAGGIVSNGPALDVILASFKTVWLKASPEEHLQRVVNQGDMRPMQATPSAPGEGGAAIRNQNALEHLKTLLTQREQEYARADSVLDTTGRTPEACTEELERIAGAVIAA